jgi:hypothetical protein
MRRARLTVLLLPILAGCHNTLILAGGGVRPVIIDKEVAPEIQCAIIAMQFLRVQQQRIALEACKELAAEDAKKGKP